MRRTLRCIVAPCLLPVLSAPPPALLLRLKVVRPARLIPEGPPQENGPEAVATSSSSSPANGGLPLAEIPDPATLLAELLGPVTPATQSINNDAIPSLTRLVCWLAERYGTTARPLLQPPDDPQACLLALLGQAELFARPLRFERSDLRRDCGDLIWMGPEGP
ncbi:MAG: hypothetical protein ACK5RA_13095, partial [Cyanobacteriota bacterium]